MEIISTDTFILHFTKVGPSYKRNQHRRRFAKSARFHAGLESRLQNQASTTKTPRQHPAEEPAEHSDAESSSSPASPPVLPVPIVDDFEDGAPVVNEDAEALRTPAVSARPPIRLLPPIPWTYKAPCRCIQAMRRRMWSSCAKRTDSGRLRIFTTTLQKSGLLTVADASRSSGRYNN